MEKYFVKIFFYYQTFDMEILMDLHVLRPPEFENHFFLAVAFSVRVCYEHDSRIIR